MNTLYALAWLVIVAVVLGIFLSAGPAGWVMAALFGWLFAWPSAKGWATVLRRQQ